MQHQLFYPHSSLGQYSHTDLQRGKANAAFMLIPNDATVDLWLWSFDPLDPGDPLDSQDQAPSTLLPLTALSLTTEEQSYAAGLKNKVLRSRWIEARTGLRRILAAYLGIRPEQIQFSRNRQGKPYLENQDHSLSSLQFNLSHTPHWCAVIVAQHMQVGVDIEQPRPVSAKLWPRVLTEAERAEIATFPESEQPQAFLRSWTRKEALGKALGHGVLPHLGRTQTGLCQQDGLMTLALETTETASQACYMRDLPAHPLLVGAIATSSTFCLRERNYRDLPA